MGDYHYWHFRRAVRVAIAIAFATVAYCQASASAAESTVKAAKTGTSGGVSEALLSASANSTLLGAEPLGLGSGNSQELSETAPIDQTTVTPSDGVATDLSAIEAAAGMVDADFGMEEQAHELILSLQRKRDVLSNAFIGLQRGQYNYVPVNELARIFQFPSTLNPAQQTISGYFLNPENQYKIDVQNGTYTVNGETATLPVESFLPTSITGSQDEIFLTPEALNLIWPLELEIDFSKLSLDITTPKKLPFELERERRKNQEQLENKDTTKESLDLAHIYNGYKWLGPQTFNISDSLRWDTYEDGLENSLVVAGRGDMLGATADYTLSFLSNKQDSLDLNNTRFRLTREDDGSGTLLPYGLRTVQAGDISARPSDLIAPILSGRGVYASSDSRRRNQGFDTITIEGIAQPGWEVELYRSRELLDYGYVDNTGVYRFLDVPLNYGRNEFDITLYGPQGQIEQRQEVYSIKNSTLRPGETTFEASVLDTRKPLINSGKNRSSSNEGWSQFLRVNHGINHWLNGYATFTQTPTKEGDKKYATIGTTFNALNGTGQVELYKDLQGGTAIDAGFVRKFAGINTSFRAALFNDFESPDSGFGDSAKTFESEFRASKNFDLDFAGLTLGFDTRYIKRENGNTDTIIGNRQSLHFDSFSITNNINTRLDEGHHTRTQGQTSLNTSFTENWSLRSTLDYNVYPDLEADTSKFVLRYTDLDKFTSSLTVGQGIKDNDKTDVRLAADYDFGTFLGGAEVGWSRDDGVDFIVRADTTLGPDGKDNRYIATTDYRGYNTALEAQLYEDRNQDGQFSEGDIPVQGARIRVNRRKSDPSDANGRINLLGAGAPGFATVTLDRDSLANSFLVPLQDGYSTVLRPGTKPFINFPLYPSGTIDGTVRNADGSAMAGMVVQLLDENGTFLQEAPTLFDGFYVFEFVRPGTYTVQVSPSHQVNVPPKTVTVTSEDLFAYGVDLILLEQASEVSVTDDSVVRDGGRVAQLNHAPVADGTLLPAPSSSDGQFDAVVRAVRIGEHPYMVRLVLDLSEPTTYSITAEDDKRIINIDLPGTAWDATREWTLDKHPMFQSCEVFSIDNGSGTRLRLTSRRPINIFYNATIPAENGLPDRVYVDFLRK